MFIFLMILFKGQDLPHSRDGKRDSTSALLFIYWFITLDNITVDSNINKVYVIIAFLVMIRKVVK